MYLEIKIIIIIGFLLCTNIAKAHNYHFLLNNGQDLNVYVNLMKSRNCLSLKN